MAFRLNLDEPVPDELRRCAGEQLARAVEALEDGRDRETGVHDARKAIKKTRALLRLARPGVPRAMYRQENTALRDAARTLSQVRDADVLVATVDDLARRAAGRVPADTFAALRACVAVPATTAAPDPDAAVAEGRAALAAIAARVPEWPLERCDERDLLEGVADAYRRGRRDWRAARRTPTAEALHEWRKRVKDLWYHQRLLRDLWPAVLKAEAKETERLAELLGDDHDLAVLRERLADPALGLPAAADADELRALVEERRAELQGAAVPLAARIYGESPTAFAERLERWAQAGRRASRFRRT